MTKILVVDDVEANRYVFSKILTLEGFEVITADNGQVAIQKATQENPDLILLDINMPGLNGFQVCERLKQEPQTDVIPIILVSATDQEYENRIRGIQLGAIDYMIEPVNKEELLARVRSNLRAKGHIDRAEEDAYRFKILAEIGNLLFASLTTDRLSSEIPEKIMSMFEAEGVAILYRERMDGKLRWTQVGGLFAGFSRIDPEVIKPGGYYARALESKGMTTLSRSEMMNDPDWAVRLTSLPFENLIVSPLRYKEYSKGLLLLARRKALLSKEEQNPLEILSSRITAAFLNQEAFQSLQRLNDLTARRNIETQEEILKHRTDLSYTSHDLKTPLNAIIGYASLLTMKVGDEPKNREAIERIMANSRDLLKMIEKVIDGFQETPVKAAEFDLGTLIHDHIQNQLVPLLFGKEVDVRSDVEPGLRLFSSDVDLIKHLLSNLFSNAAKFTPHGFIEVRARNKTEEKRGGIEIAVTDTGIGIDAERLPHIFEPYTHEAGYEGSGLGLSIVRDIVRQMKGKIDVKSERGAGSTFSVWLPHN